VNGRGSDLAFPHHEFSAAHRAALTHGPLTDAYVDAGMVAWRGEKMSKSLGNLVLVSTLIGWGADPRAICLGLLARHCCEDWEWADPALLEAPSPRALPGELRARLAGNLDTSAAINAFLGIRLCPSRRGDHLAYGFLEPDVENEATAPTQW